MEDPALTPERPGYVVLEDWKGGAGGGDFERYRDMSGQSLPVFFQDGS